MGLNSIDGLSLEPGRTWSRPKSVRGTTATINKTRDQIDATFHGIMARSFGMALATA